MVESTKKLIAKSVNDDILTLAASLAFYTVLAISPLIVLMITFISSLNLRLLSLIAQDEFAELMKIVHHAGVFLVYAAMFSILLRWMPDSRPNWTAALIGGFLTSFLFLAGKILIGIYIGQTAVGSTYGAAGSLVVLLIWAFYSSLIFLFGAEIASLLGDENGFEPGRRSRRERLMA